jgi:hypothetical protein
MKSHRGTLILVFGILGIMSCFPLGLAAWIMGGKDLKEMDAGTMDPGGRGSTSAGRVCGMIGTLLGGIMLLVFMVLFALGALTLLWRVSRPNPATPSPQPPATVERAVPAETNTAAERPPQRP